MSIAEKLVTVAENQQKVYDTGIKAQYDKFWDAYQINGTRTSYMNGFYGAGWTDDNFKPKYDIIATGSAGWMFNNTKIKKISGVKFDISKCTSVQGMFYNSAFEELPVLDVSEAADLKNMFYNASKLKKIEKLILGSNQIFENTFKKCSKLTDIVVQGEIATDIDFSACPLSVESMINILNCLVDYRGTEYQNKYTLKFSDDCWRALESSDIPADSIAPDVQTWKEICSYKGWNV